MATYEKLFISLNPDGSLCRNYPFPFTPPTDERNSSPKSRFRSFSKDVPLNSTHNTSIRIFMPELCFSSNIQNKLPIIIYFHPGGFILCSPSIAPIHNFTARLSAVLPAIVVSVDHRLSPEHHLPAAYDDALDALLWLHDKSDPWLKNHADLSRIFLMGSSSGGNITYHLALRASSLDIKIAGVRMDQPFFGGEERTESEMRMADDKYVPLAVTDLMWEMALPVGANRDHEYSNPKRIKGMGKGLARFLVRGYLGDPLIDRMRGMAEMLEEEGASVVKLLDEAGYHGIELYDGKKAEEMVNDVRLFIYEDTDL